MIVRLTELNSDYEPRDGVVFRERDIEVPNIGDADLAVTVLRAFGHEVSDDCAATLAVSANNALIASWSAPPRPNTRPTLRVWGVTVAPRWQAGVMDWLTVPKKAALAARNAH